MELCFLSISWNKNQFIVIYVANSKQATPTTLTSLLPVRFLGFLGTGMLGTSHAN